MGDLLGEESDKQLHLSVFFVERDRPGWATKKLHDLRRTATRQLIQAGVAQFVAQQLVGWETVTMFKRYAITTGPDLRAGVRQLSDYVTRQTPEAPITPSRSTRPTHTVN